MFPSTIFPIRRRTVASVCCLIIGFIGYSVIVPIDRWLYVILLPLSNSEIGTVWAHSADMLGNGFVLLLITLVLCFTVPGSKGPERRQCMAASMEALALTGIIGQFLKFVVGRPRPGTGLDSWNLSLFSVKNDFHSFPSGHAAGAFAIALVFSSYFPSCRPALISFALFVSLGRLVGQSHFLTDIAAGLLIAMFTSDLVLSQKTFVRNRLRAGYQPIKTNL